MNAPPPYDPAAVLITEAVKVGLPLRTKIAFVEVACARGLSMSELLRAAVDAEITRAAIPREMKA